MSNPFEPPPNPPLGQTSSTSHADHADAHDVTLPDEPPPAYSSVAGAQGHTTVDAGPARMDFSGPPPIPDRLQPQHTTQSYQASPVEAHITGVGYGYGPGRHGSFTPNDTAGTTGRYEPPPMPPRHPSVAGRAYKPPSSPMGTAPSSSGFFGGGGGGGAGPSRPAPARDTSPTEVPTPGRPFLRNGMLLVYPKNHYCQKCDNTGYKNNDPSNPCNKDWSKYGKPYNSALAHSFITVTRPDANPSTQASNNFQRPLPDFQPPSQNNYAHLPPPPGQGKNGGGWNQHPGNYAPPTGPMYGNPPPPPMNGNGMMGPPPPSQIHVQHHYAGSAPPGAIRVAPGDPRIGGNVCWRCGGYGRELSFFGFDDGKCWECRGLGRVFY